MHMNERQRFEEQMIFYFGGIPPWADQVREPRPVLAEFLPASGEEILCAINFIDWDSSCPVHNAILIEASANPARVFIQEDLQ